ncbi:MAG TPA: SIR2 family protein [Thermoanaerobaculia bacterium]|jgi:hypothetical protein|nr:SIR2 family protein [Thermoanaerobaculia bacterium]
MEVLIGWEVQALPASLAAGTFTPFLGAGASSLRSRDEVSFVVYPWDNVGRTLTTIYVDLAGEESRHFLRSFSQERLRMTDEQLAEFMPSDLETGEPRESDGDSLIDFQVALVRTMRRLTKVFGDEFVRQVPSLRELPDCAVSFSIREEDEQDAWLKLCEAAAIAKRLRERKDREPGFRGADSQWLPPNSGRTFCVERVYERLVVLTRLLVSEADEKFVSSRFRTKFRENPDLSSVGDALLEAKVLRGKLRLDMMQWLGDLLEYSLVYWIPRFPTTLELAFELGLAVPSGPPRRPELAQAAQAFDAIDPQNMSAGDYIKDLMEYCESGMKDHSVDLAYRRFYVAIAAALCDQWDHYRDNVHARGADRGTAGAAQFRRHSKGRIDRAEATALATVDELPRVAFMPIAATTNYDRGLELVFEKFKIPYHVLFPIQSRSSKGAVLQWVLRSIVPDEMDYDFEMSSKDSQLPEEAELHGPVIVKLHGAPTLKKHKDKHGGQIKHRIVVSEKEYLDALQEGSSALEWFEAEMFKPLAEEARYDAASRARTIWFLGYSIADWNVRLRLYSHLRSTPRDERQLRAVNRDYDPFRHSILKDLKVALCHGDLSKVPQAIRDHYNRRYETVGSTVRKLVDELRRLG